MNETTPPPGDTASSQPARGFDRFLAWLRGLGLVRGEDRWFAGVAGGIAVRAGIDPVIVRGVFVVLTLLGGSGILLYLAGWLLLPDSSGRIHVEEIVRGRASAGVIVTAVLVGAFIAVPLFFSLLSGLFAGSWFFDSWAFMSPPDWLRTTFSVIWFFVLLPALIIGAIIWLSHGRHRGNPPHGRDPGLGTDAHGPASHPGAPFAPPHPQRAYEARQTQGAPEPHGTADARGATESDAPQPAPWSEQFGCWSRNVREEAQQWNELGQQHHRDHRIGAAHVVLTLSLALLASGATAAWMLTRSADGDLVLTAGLIAALSVFALSLIVAGIRGRHTGWVGFLTFVGVIALIFAPFTRLMPEHTRFVPFGSAVEKVSASDDPNSAVVLLAGSSKLDLTGLGSTSGAREIEIWQLFGSSTVELPEDHAARVQVDMLGGSIRGDSPGSQQSGVFLSHTVGSHMGASDTDEMIQVRVRVLLGSVRVEGSGRSSVIVSSNRIGGDAAIRDRTAPRGMPSTRTTMVEAAR